MPDLNTRMSDVSQFRTVRPWRAALGMLPVLTRDSADNGERYVLLNGATGNFCLDFIGGIDRSTQRGVAWSCDVGHYVTCGDDFIVVNRWDKQSPEEKYPLERVVTQLHEFHRHLEKTTPDRSRSIAAHALRVFRSVRTVVEERDNGTRSLRVFLNLLASAATEQYRLVDGNMEVLGITPEILEASRTIPDTSWRQLYNDLSGIGRYDVPGPPDFELVLRHASGTLFQDAHLEAELSPTLFLPGLEGPATVASAAIPSETGIYFTPPVLARTLAEEATRNIPNIEGRPLLLFDPACGSSELLKECLRLLKVKQYPGRVRVIGWDKSAASVDMARFVLAWEKRSWPTDQVEIEVAQQDSLMSTNWPASVDILAMNPPFKSWNLMEPETQEAAARILGGSSKPNLAMVFARRALDVLSDGGTLAMITPNSLFEASSGKYVREKLAEILTPQLIARLGDQTIFARALVDAGMYVGTRRPGHPVTSAILWADSRPSSLNHALRGLRKWREAEIAPITDDGFSVYHRDDIGTTGDRWVARAYEAWATYESIQRTKRTVVARKVFDIHQGVRLGNDVFIVSKEYWQKLDKTEARFFRPAVMNPSVQEGKLDDRYYVFYSRTEGLPELLNEELLQAHLPQYFAERLAPAKPTLLRRKSIAKEGLNWWDLERPRAWQQVRVPKLISKYFGGKRPFAFDRTGDFVVVVGLAWLLKRGAVELFITETEIYLAILAYLSSAIADSLLKYASVQVSGGQLDLSARWIGNLPIPNLAKLEPAELNKLVRAGAAISDGTIEWEDLNELVLSILNR
jgi:adenine-specific DNA-methyltransferase